MRSQHSSQILLMCCIYLIAALQCVRGYNLGLFHSLGMRASRGVRASAHALSKDVFRANKSNKNKVDMKLNSIAAVGISLDSSVLPRSNWALKAAQAYGAYAFLLLASYKVMGVLVRSGAIDSVADSIANTYDEIKIKTKEFVNNKYIGSTFDALSTAYYMLTDEILPLVAFALRVFASKISLYTEDLRSTLGNVFNLFPPEDIDIKEWKTCTLFERESISPRHNRYRFELANADGVLPLYVGQELMMCAVDEKDRVYKESFFPVSDPSIKGYFDIIVKNDKDPIDNFANAINNLELGDELAFKAGKYRLNYAGADERIDSLALVASGSGIEPVLGVLRGILRDRDSTVEDIELLWLNEKKTDYVLNDDVQALEYRHVEKLFVSRVIQRDLYGANILKSREVADSVSPYEEGRLAIICGPDFVLSKARQLLLSSGYPAENVLSIVM